MPEPKCGTSKGYRRHYWLGEPACAACKVAHAQATPRTGRRSGGIDQERSRRAIKRVTRG